MWKLHDDMEKCLKVANSESGLSGSFQVSEYYQTMVLASYLEYSAFQNMAISIAIACTIILLVTMNWRVTILASFALVCVLSCVLAEMVVFG